MSKKITESEVKAHTSAEKGMYIIVDNNVYDVTNFVDEHPGGAKILKRVAGKDATKQFWKVCPQYSSILSLVLLLTSGWNNARLNKYISFLQGYRPLPRKQSRWLNCLWYSITTNRCWRNIVQNWRLENWEKRRSYRLDIKTYYTHPHIRTTQPIQCFSFYIYRWKQTILFDGVKCIHDSLDKFSCLPPSRKLEWGRKRLDLRSRAKKQWQLNCVSTSFFLDPGVDTLIYIE